MERYGFPLTVLSVGLDPLPEEASAWGKSLEAQLGPALAESMRSSLRDIDLCAVLSHREMLAIMPHTDLDGARIAAQRICQTIAGLGGALLCAWRGDRLGGPDRARKGLSRPGFHRGRQPRPGDLKHQADI